MKICFATTNFPRYLGDSEGTFVFEAARAVARQGHQVYVVAQHWPGFPVYEQLDGIKVVRFPYWYPPAKEVLRYAGGGLPIAWKKSWLARVQITPFIIVHTLAIAWYGRRCDIIHAHWSLSAGAAWLGQAIHRRPILATLQGSDIFQVPRSWLGRWLTKVILRHCNYISVLSQALAASTIALGIPKSVITVIPNGVDVSQFFPSVRSRWPMILYVGTLITRKGVNYLLQAMSKVVQVQPSFQLVIVGEGPERSNLEKMARDLNLSKHVFFSGAQSPDEVRQWMQQAKIFILPSVEEGLGVVLLESMACGTPIIATAVGGIPDVVTPDVGILVPPADSDSLAKAILHLLQDDERWRKMSENARKQAEEKYDWQRIAGRFIEIYEKLLNQKHGH